MKFVDNALKKLNQFSPVGWVLARLFIGTIFAYSGFSKLIEPIENFRGIITQYEVIPYVFVPWIAHIIPWTEFLFGVFTVLGYLPRVSALVLTLLSFGFLVVIGASQLLLASVPMSCGCFGQNGLIDLNVRQIFVVDCFNVYLGIRLVLLKDHPFSLDRLLRK